ncbi:MAG: imidazolonepropionase [Bacteroidetes bacterium]|nr:imidazolonepropionase [Bacteroidota bacterium]
MRQKHLYTNIKNLCGITTGFPRLKVGKQLNDFVCVENAWLLISEKGTFEQFGEMKDIPEFSGNITDCSNKLILPCFIDSHTHLIHANYRESEFVDRINGLTYEQIALRGGGILNSAKKISEISENELFELSYERLIRAIETGTGAIEIKSGYGLSFENELKMLRVANQIKIKSPIPVKITFLGAHAFPEIYKYNHEVYIKIICDEMLPVISKENLADYIDVFCEQNYFSPEEMEIILEIGWKYGLKPKVHVNQFNSIGGIQSAVKNNAVSVDHLEVISENDIVTLKHSQTIATLLPACSFFIKIPYSPAKILIENNIPFCLASDYNPGSSPCLDMKFVISLACIKMNLTPEEAFNAATLNAAAALELQYDYGSIEIGKKANFIITKPVSSLNYLPYSFAENCIEKTIIN